MVKCPSCGTHEVSLRRICHNSDCVRYGDEVTVYEGWRDPPQAALAAAWVPCAEKAPPEPGEYMAVKQWWRGNGELHREAAALGWYSNRWEELVNGMPAIGEVTHWLRIPDLPAPPKE